MADKKKSTIGGIVGGGLIGLVTGGPVGAVIGSVLGGVGGSVYADSQNKDEAPPAPKP